MMGFNHTAMRVWTELLVELREELVRAELVHGLAFQDVQRVENDLAVAMREGPNVSLKVDGVPA